MSEHVELAGHAPPPASVVLQVATENPAIPVFWSE